MDEYSLSHTTWDCKYHIVFAPKYRRKAIYGKLKADIGKILRELCNWKGVEIIEAHACADHIHMYVSIPPKLSVSAFVGYLKGKEYATNIPTTCGIEIQIWKQAFLVSRILREHGRTKRESSTGIYTGSRKRGYNDRPDKYKRVYGPIQPR